MAALEWVLGTVETDGDGRVRGDFNHDFLLRSVVLAKDGRTVLNPQPGHAALGDLFSRGYFPYGQVKAQDYLPMLRGALTRSGSSPP